MRLITPEERRARLSRRHRLASALQADDPVAVARSLVALHATDPATTVLSVWARCATPERFDAAMYDDRTLVKVMGMRRTLFVVPTPMAPVVRSACAAVAARERRRLVKLVEAAGLASDGAAWLAQTEPELLAALTARGQATAAELTADVPALRARISFGGGAWPVEQGVAPRVLSLLATDGVVVRGRPKGRWTSTLVSWAPTATWLPSAPPPPDGDAARIELARQWLAAYGPGTVADLTWWTGWTATQVRRALSEVGPVEVDLGGSTGLVLAGDLDPVSAPETWVALLPGLDPTVMGWAGRDFYLPQEHRGALFDRNGNAGPTVWCDGRAVGAWAQRRTGDVVVRLLTDIGTEATAAVADQAARLQAWLGDIRVTPRFPTPLQRELAV